MPDRRAYITVVSGMPRSGTSLMMSMLQAGGMPVLDDGSRAPDQHNPRGYFEDSRAKRLATDSAWIEEARGKAVKVIYRLLQYLPGQFEYRVIFMLRDLEEVYDSQQDMLAAADSGKRERMIRALAGDLENARDWLRRQPHIRYLDVPYAELIAKPGPWAGRVGGFLDDELDEAAMAAAVDPALYRHRR